MKTYPMNTYAWEPIFSPLDADNLERSGLLGPVDITGKRKCHKRRLNRLSDEEHKEIPLDIGIGSPGEADAFATIPDAIISRESLNYLGLSTHMADVIWNTWINWPPYGFGREVDTSTGLYVTFIDYIILAHVQKAKDVHEDDDFKWRQCIDECGMNTSVQDAIMDINFKQIRMTKSCVDWVTDTVQMRYAGLKEIQRASCEREMQLERERSGQHGTSSNIGSHLGESSQRCGSSSQGGGSIRCDSWDPAIFKGAQDDRETLVLFKAIDLGRTDKLVNADGTIEMERIMFLLSKPPSDFSSTRAINYFTPDMDVAEFFAAYAKRRAGREAVVMITVHIPKKIILDMKEPDVFRLHYPTPEWKQLVWHSKSGTILRKPLSRCQDESLLIIGTISTGASRMYDDMKSWEEIDEHCLLRVGQGGKNMSEQYCFTKAEEGIEFLEEHGQFTVFCYSAEKIDSLIRRYN
ncbi:hypothetical protein H634G_10720 [Metarhizium anisopliae BRIP 53293]|uniref:Uncharacterized protein n=1 Tax=Metarhizium anisopliae BRIP 53293 TaxID=1291518 RepID=A0A0D9NJ40_METAN|nr:hypothetical protein H634G_10720 [Metarhizium anisopliae BRIP 53293]